MNSNYSSRKFSVVKESNVDYESSPAGQSSSTGQSPSAGQKSFVVHSPRAQDQKRNILKSTQLHERGIEVARRYHREQSDLIDVLAELDDDKTYLLFETTSLYQYTMQFHGLS